MNIDEAKQAATMLAASHDADVFHYNGNVTRSNVLSIMETIRENKKRRNMFFCVVTYGGDPHAAFKIARYIQDNYDQLLLFVPGFCKSAGTLLAVAANEVIFAPYGELGPLDIQMAQPDRFQLDSGLVISESLETLERRAAETFKAMFIEVIAEQQGLVSLNSALHAAAELTKAIYAPIMARIDPEEVGARQRALRITLDYGDRLALRSRNIDKKGLRILAEKYSSHSFVIDRQEATSLFRNVRAATDDEMALAYALGPAARIEATGNLPPTFTVLSGAASHPEEENTDSKGAQHGKAQRRGNSAKNGRNSRRTNGPTVSPSSDKVGRRGGGVRSRNSLNGGTRPSSTS